MDSKKPVIIQIDNDDNYATVVDLICYNMDLTITAFAGTVSQAKDLLGRIESGELKPDIAIVASYIERDFRDGELYAKKLRELSPKTKIIAYTEDEEADWGDYLAIKSGLDDQKSLIALLEELTKHKFNFSNEA